MIDDELLKKAIDLWNDFKNMVLYNNRYIVKHPVLDYVESFTDKNQKTIEKGKILYRARQYKEETDPRKRALKECSGGSSFWGYDEKESFVPTNNDSINDGRANPAFIKYLYASEEPYTALVEVRPYLGTKVSVAEIEIIESLNVADFSIESYGKHEGFERYLMFSIMDQFSIPSDSNIQSYIPTQYIAEFIKTLGFEGIRFNSSLHEWGQNLTIFNYEKCKAISSKLYKIKDICFEAKGLASENENDLIHERLRPDKTIPIKNNKIS